MSTHTDPPPSSWRAGTARRPSRRPSSNAEALVLVVDDDPVVLQATRERLTRVGFRVTTARTAQQALRALAERRPRLVLLDAMMPGSREESLLTELQKAKQLANVVLHSGLGMTELSALATSAGALGAIQKTGDMARFLSDFRHYWEASTGQPAPRIA
jgi:DNA-binding NtrC family response regulator